MVADRRGDYAGSLRHLARSLDVAPRARWPRINLIETHRSLGDFAAVEHEVQVLKALDDSFAPLYRVWSSVAREAGDPRAARGRAARASELDPVDPWNHVEQARVALALGDAGDAIRASQRALALRAGMAEARSTWAQALMQSGQTEAALQLLREAAAAAPTDVWCLLQASHLLRRLGRFDEALTATDAAHGRNRRSEAPWRYRYWALRDRCDFVGAEAALRRAARRAPRNPSIWKDLSEFHRQHGRLEDAEAAARRAVQTGVRCRSWKPRATNLPPPGATRSKRGSSHRTTSGRCATTPRCSGRPVGRTRRWPS
jgi:tetratricopeptide (TPR) repeat protein